MGKSSPQVLMPAIYKTAFALAHDEIVGIALFNDIAAQPALSGIPFDLPHTATSLKIRFVR